jgi:homogentisate solanesyltransferase
LATKLGVRKIAFLGSGLLLANYVAAIVVPFLIPQVRFYCFWLPFDLLSVIPARGLIIMHAMRFN